MAMATLELNDKVIEELPVPEKGKAADYYDTEQKHLVLRVNGGSGLKVWRASFTVKSAATGKSIPTTRKLGEYPVMRTRKARAEVIKLVGKVLDDPTKYTSAEKTVHTFESVAKNFIELYVDEKKLRSKHEIVRSLNKYILPRWGSKPIGAIEREHVIELLDHMVKNHGARMADYVLAMVRKIMRWHATRVSNYNCPIVPGMGRDNPSERKRTRVIGQTRTKKWVDEELRRFWQACGEIGTFGALLKVALLTAQRKDKVATMRWDDVKDGVWTIAHAPREKGHAGELRLPRQVLDIIEAQPRIAGNPYVFAGRGPGPFNSFSEAKADLDKLLPIDKWVIHDVRRTAKSLMSRAGVKREISEIVLGHVIRGIEGVYEHHDFSKEKTQALVKLAKEVGKMVNPKPSKPRGGNVSDLDQERRKRRGVAA